MADTVLLKKEEAEKITATYQMITPEIAKQWLDAYVNIRVITPSVVDKYARDMSMGKWNMSNDFIIFDTKGRMINGFHRCAAIVKSKRPFLMGVAYGYPPESVHAFDHGKQRFVQDVYEDVTKRSAAIARALLRVSNIGASQSPSYAEVAEVVDRYKEAIDFTINEFKTGKIGITRAAVQAAVARAYYHIPIPMLKRFVEVLYNGVSNSKEEQPIILLRDSLINRKSSGGVDEQRLDYGKTERALYAYLHNEKLTKLYLPTKEFFPFPEK
jgi:hypothetical protein